MTAGIDPELAAELRAEARELVATWPRPTATQIDRIIRIVNGEPVRPPRRRLSARQPLETARGEGHAAAS